MFLIARAMSFYTYGIASPYGIYIIIATVLLSLLTLICLFWLLGRTPLVAYNRSSRLIVALVINIALQKIVVEPLAGKLQTYVGLQHDIFVSRLAAEKLGDKESAIKALEFYDASIKTAVKNGEALFKPFENRFAQIIAGL
jgi:hypothetical protein